MDKPYFSHGFAINCGTVSVDVKRSKVIVLRWRKTDRRDLLPWGEPLEKTGLLITLEESGVPVQLLPFDMKTLATIPSDCSKAPVTTTEAFAMTQRILNGVLEIIL